MSSQSSVVLERLGMHLFLAATCEDGEEFAVSTTPARFAGPAGPTATTRDDG
jgi:hypothetical protein